MWVLFNSKVGVLQLDIGGQQIYLPMAEEEEGVVDNWEDADTEVSDSDLSVYLEFKLYTQHTANHPN